MQASVTHIHTHIHMKWNEMLPFVTRWMSLKCNIQSEIIRQRKKSTIWSHFCVESKRKYILIHRHRQQIGDCQKKKSCGGNGWRGQKVQAFSYTAEK